MPPKTILHIIDTTGPGGAETVFIQLADLLRERDWNSIAVIRGPGWVHEELKRRGIRSYVIPAKGSFAFKFLTYIIQLIRKENVSVIQSHLLGSNVYAAIAGILTGTPVVATYHGTVDVNTNERFRWLKYKAMEKGINRYVVVSEHLMKNINERGLLDLHQSVVIYNGIDLKRYGRRDTKALREQLGLSGSTILVGSLGNVRPAKNYENLIAAGAKLLESQPNVHFVIAGHKKDTIMVELEEQMKSLGVTDHFHFIGFCQDCAEFLGQVDYFVLSSWSEGFSIATIEAMATRLPIVVTKCGGPEEIVTNGVTGLLVPKNNSSALAAGMKRLLDDDVLSEKLAEGGLRHVEQTFNIERMLSSYEKIYREITA